MERVDSMIEELTALKKQVGEVEARLDAILRALSEQRGALQAKPAAYNAITAAVADSPADKKPVAVRCAAITSAGSRCSRAAVSGSRYCRQHQLAHQK
jgi:hypothetical protein